MGVGRLPCLSCYDTGSMCADCLARQEDAILSDLARVKATFQLRAITAALGIRPDSNPQHHTPRQSSERSGAVGAEIVNLDHSIGDRP